MDTASDKALQRFAELMIEKIKQVEDNWQKPWFGIKGGGLPQNIEGRTYNGVNSFMLFLLSEKEQYSLPVYTERRKVIPSHLLEFLSKRQERKENTFRRI